jgi:hypothetical protein
LDQEHPTTWEPSTTWSPTVYLNDAGTTPSVLLPNGNTPAATAYTIANGVMQLRMVNTGRTHRVSLVW